MIGSHCRLRFRSFLLSIIALHYLESPIEKIHHYSTGLHQSYPPSSVIPKSSRPSMQGTTHEVDNESCGNVRYGGSRSSGGKKHLHMKITESLAYTEDPRTNDNYFRSERDDLIDSLGMGKYGGSGEHLFVQIHCSVNFSGYSFLLGQK